MRNAFTLIELLVVIAIIAILMALLLPAIQKVREAANKMRCGNHMKQFGIALHAHHNDFGRLPPGARRRNFDFMEDQGSWMVQLLPYMEQRALFEVFSTQIRDDGSESCPFPNGNVNHYPPCSLRNVVKDNGYAINYYEVATPPYARCPSDDFDHERHPSANYGASMGPQCFLSPCNYDPFGHLCRDVDGVPESQPLGDTYDKTQLRGLFNDLDVRMTLFSADIKDGTSSTIMLGEVRPGQVDFFGYFDVHSRWMNNQGGTFRLITLPPINYQTDDTRCCSENACYNENGAEYGGDPARSIQNWHLSFGFRSAHPGGANFLFADGAVHFLTQELEDIPRQYLGCRNDGRHIEELP